MTVDVEDYFQVEAFFEHVSRNEWDRRECRIERNVDRILELFDATGRRRRFLRLAGSRNAIRKSSSTSLLAAMNLASHGLHIFAPTNSRARCFRQM